MEVTQPTRLHSKNNIQQTKSQKGLLFIEKKREFIKIDAPVYICNVEQQVCK